MSSSHLTPDGTGTIPGGSTETWKDKKRYLWLIGLVVPSLAFVAMLGWALSQLATLQDSVEEQGERPGQCLEAMLPSGA